MKQHSASRCQAKDPSTCPYHGSTSSAAVSRGDINAFLDAKMKEEKTFTPYKNASGELVLDCDSEEGTCWKHSNHMTKEQQRIRQLKEGESDIRYASAGVDGGSSYVDYDSYHMFMKNYSHKLVSDTRPKDSPMTSALYDKVKTALGSDTRVYIYGGKDASKTKGYIGFATAYDSEGPLDYVEYQYENVNGEIKFYTPKKMFKKSEEVNAKQIQKDVAKSRNLYHRSELSRSASSG